jgi:hypothetical protein
MNRTVERESAANCRSPACSAQQPAGPLLECRPREASLTIRRLPRALDAFVGQACAPPRCLAGGIALGLRSSLQGSIGTMAGGGGVALVSGCSASGSWRPASARTPAICLPRLRSVAPPTPQRSWSRQGPKRRPPRSVAEPYLTVGQGGSAADGNSAEGRTVLLPRSRGWRCRRSDSVVRRRRGIVVQTMASVTTGSRQTVRPRAPQRSSDGDARPPKSRRQRTV